MHNPGHKDKTITNVSYSVNKQKLPAKANEYPGYGGTKTTRTMTTTSSTSGSPSKGSDEFNFTFAQASKKGLKTLVSDRIKCLYDFFFFSQKQSRRKF